MPKQITVADIQPISLTISLGEEDQVSLSVRYLRLNEEGQPIEGFIGTLSVELERGMAQKTLNYVKNSVKPWIRELEGI